MNVRLLAPAAAELDEAAAWYAAQAPERRFIYEMQTARKRIAERPWHPLGNGVRRFRLERFPYGLIYVVEERKSWSSPSLTCIASRTIDGRVCLGKIPGRLRCWRRTLPCNCPHPCALPFKRLPIRRRQFQRS